MWQLYIRYVDDIAIFDNDKGRLWGFRDSEVQTKTLFYFVEDGE